jgi:hypothetical protein
VRIGSKRSPKRTVRDYIAGAKRKARRLPSARGSRELLRVDAAELERFLDEETT